jgi:hypothetical protein
MGKMYENVPYSSFSAVYVHILSLSVVNVACVVKYEYYAVRTYSTIEVDTNRHSYFKLQLHSQIVHLF